MMVLKIVPALYWMNLKKIKIIHIKNSGPSVARNIGIRKSKGELISFLDSDDYWHKDKLKIQVNFMNKYEDIKIVTSNLWSINKKKRIKKVTYLKYHILKILMTNFV